MARALYRKYRSKSFDQVVGQQHVTETLKNALKKGRINHAYLFTGPHGVGKTSVARILAHAVNDLAYNDESTHLDIIEIDAASNRRIDDIRDLREKVNISPVNAKYKVYIIDEVHMLTGESFNALLKTLEEPPEHVIFILATTEAHKLPNTIVSRAQRFQFRPISRSDAVKHLTNLAKQEKIKIDSAALELIAAHGNGSFRDSISLLDQLSGLAGDDTIKLQDVEDILGLAPSNLVDQILGLISDGESQQLQALVNDLLYSRGISPNVLLKQLLPKLTEQATGQPALYDLIDELLEVNRSSDPALKLMIGLVRAATKAGDANKPAQALQAKTITKAKSVEPPVKRALNPKPAEINQDFSNFWLEVVKVIKQQAPVLFSVIKTVKAEADKDHLRLITAYKLHAGKLADAKYQAAIVKAFKTLGQDCPALEIIVDKSLAKANSQYAIKAADPPKANKTTADVLAMMGGGEVVNA